YSPTGGRPAVRSAGIALQRTRQSITPCRGLMAIFSVRRSFLWWSLAALLALGAWFWWASRTTAGATGNAAPAPVQVRTALVEARDMPIRLQGLGTVQAWASVTVRARIDGRLE